MITLSVNRIGGFSCSRVSKGPQCGYMGAQDYRYEVSIIGVESSLDDNGFVIDNLEVEKYFKERYAGGVIAAQSCERMATEAVKYFKDIVQTECLGVRVRIYGADKSFIEAEWKRHD